MDEDRSLIGKRFLKRWKYAAARGPVVPNREKACGKIASLQKSAEKSGFVAKN
jgi:hypothetical protein